MTTQAQAETHQRDLAALIALAIAAVRELWPSFTTPEAVRDALADILPGLVGLYGSAASALAADWYDEIRDELEIDGRFRAIVADLPDLGRTESLAGWGVDPLFGEPDVAAAQALVEGGLQRIVANASRDTVIASALADPRALGWQRIGTGSADCGFCRLLIGRGAVYSETTANFAAHDNCDCTAVPAFGGQPVPVKPFTPSKRQATDADRARLRAYLRANP